MKHDPATSDKRSAVETRPRTWLPTEVVALGWVSLFTDAASDMIYPLLPAFLMGLGGGASALGWLEGVSEAVSAIMKVASGRSSDVPSRRKPMVVLGYGLSAATRPLFALAFAPWHAVLVRAGDRVGKGLRGPPRDAILADAVSADRRGAAFGFHRMMDNFGAVLGSLVAFGLLRSGLVDVRKLFVISAIPGALAVFVAITFVRSNTGHAAPKAEKDPQPGTTLPPGVRRYLTVLALFTLSASGDLFLLRRLTDLGLPVAFVPLAWISLNLGKGVFNVPGGWASDRFGHKRVLVVAWCLYAATYAAFGAVASATSAWLLFAPYALHYGLAEGGQRALLAELVPASLRGRAFGTALAVEGAAILPANVAFGWAYDRFGAPASFSVAAVLALFAALMLAALVDVDVDKRQPTG